MIESRVERNISFRDFLANYARTVPFSRDAILEMAIDQLNDGKPLTIITQREIFIISPESIMDVLNPPSVPPPAPLEAKPEVPAPKPEPPAAEPAVPAPALPGDLPEDKPQV